MLHHSWGALHQPFMLKCGCIKGRIWGWSAWAHFQVDLGFVKGGFINQTFFCMSISSFVNIKYLVLILCRVLYMRPLSWGHRTRLNNWTTLIWTELCKTSTLNVCLTLSQQNLLFRPINRGFRGMERRRDFLQSTWPMISSSLWDLLRWDKQ